MFLMLGSRPDIAQAVSKLSRFMSNPGLAHWEALRKLLMFVKGSKEMCLKYDSGPSKPLHAYCDQTMPLAATQGDRQRGTSFYGKDRL